MPKRTGQITDLEKYFWKAENIQKLLGTDYAKKLVKEAGYNGKTAIGSKEFVRVASEFGNLEQYYRKQGKNADVQENCGGKAKSGRPTYLFYKCLACRIITQLDPETKIKLASHFDRKKLGRMVLSKKELQSGIWEMVTDTDLMKLLETQCYFQTSRIINPDNDGLAESEKESFAGNVLQDSQICWMHGTDLCSPQTLVNLCSIFRQGRGKGTTTFTYADLDDISQCFHALYPVTFSEDAYIDLLREQKKWFCNGKNDKCKKRSNAISSNFILRNAIKNGGSNPGGMMSMYLDGLFREYFARQFEDKERAEKWFERLTQRYYQLRKYSVRQDNLHIQVQRWCALWEYVICRYKELRGEERKQIKKEKCRRLRPVNLEVLLEQIFWEYSHEKVYEDAARKKDKNAHEEETVSGGNQKERQKMLKKWQREIDFVIGQFLQMREEMQKISPEREIIRLTGKAFYDLEIMVGYMTQGWTVTTSRGKFTNRIIKEALNSQGTYQGLDS